AGAGVFEGAVALVVVGGVARSALAFVLPLARGSVADEEVEPAVAVVVDPGRAVAGGLDDVRLARAAEEVAVVEVRPLRDVLEPYRAVPVRRHRPRAEVQLRRREQDRSRGERGD